MYAYNDFTFFGTHFSNLIFWCIDVHYLLCELAGCESVVVNVGWEICGGNFGGETLVGKSVVQTLVVKLGGDIIIKITPLYIPMGLP